MPSWSLFLKLQIFEVNKTGTYKRKLKKEKIYSTRAKWEE
jgi:hypothetical protein